MSLLESLLQNSPSPQERLAQVAPFLQQPGRNSLMDFTGGSEFTPGAGGSTALAQEIARFIQSRPGVQFSVGGLEGYKGTGQISTGHIDNSQHYTGHAGDVSWIGGPRFENEMQALDWLERKLQRRYGDALTELIWREPDHFDHLHYGTRPGG